MLNALRGGMRYRKPRVRSLWEPRAVISMGKTRCGVLSFLLACALGAITAAPAAADAAVDRAAAGARDMTHEEIYRLYAAHSWIWNAGASHYGISRRQFKAWSEEGLNPSYADGRWYLPGNGRLCFRATWSSTEWSVIRNNCFRHRVGSDGRIFQRALPDGEWYVFANHPVRPGDEILKLRKGDYATRKAGRIQAKVDPVRPATACASSPTLVCLLFGRQ